MLTMFGVSPILRAIVASFTSNACTCFLSFVNMNFTSFKLDVENTYLIMPATFCFMKLAISQQVE
jgi:hypothetical protein